VRSSRLPAIAAGLALVLPAAAQAADEAPAKSYRIFGQLTSELERNLAENDDDPTDVDYTKFKQLASLNLEWSRFTIGAQLEFLDWSVPLELRDRLDLDRIRDGFELRKYYLDYQSPKFSGRLGTFFSSFGRGLTLYVQKNEALGFDEPIHGATASLTLDHLDVTVLGGRVAEPVLQNQHGDEFEDEVIGGRVVGRLPFDLYLGGSAVRAELDRFFPEGTDEVEVWSVEAGGTGLGGVLDVAGEFSELERQGFSRTEDGFGRYLSAAVYVGPLSFLAEYKDYYNFSFRYNQPPNAGRADEAYEHDDVKGPRLLVSADFWSIGSLVHASFAEFDSHTSRGSPDDRRREWYAGWEQTAGPVYFQASYFDRAFSDRGIDETHTIGDVHLTIGRGSEIIVGYDQRLEASDFFRRDTTRTNLTYSISPWGTASLRYAYEDRSGSPKEDFWGVELQYLPKPTIVITVFGGGEPGGLVCAGGQCRIEPRFEGGRATLTWRF
jgi:hypothetical protein